MILYAFVQKDTRLGEIKPTVSRSYEYVQMSLHNFLWICENSYELPWDSVGIV